MGQTTHTATQTTRPARSVTTARIVAGIIAALILVQAALAGSFLSGTAASLGVHRMVGMAVLTLMGIVMVVTAVPAARHNRWILPASIVALFAIFFQVGMGFAGFLSIHVPLGVALFGGYLTIALTLKDKTTRRDE